MQSPKTSEVAILQRIADAIGVPVERFSEGDAFVDTDRCLRLWFRIGTAEGRRRALETLQAIGDEEHLKEVEPPASPV